MKVILPENYADDFKPVLSQPYNNYRESLPVVNYSNCYFTHSGIGLKHFKLVEETLFRNITKKYRQHFYKYALYKYFFSKSIKLKEKNILLIHNHWSSGYHHWVTEALLKLSLIDTSNYSLLIPEDSSRFIYDSIALYNFKEVIKLPKNCGLKASSVTLIANPDSGNFNPALLSSLKQQLIEKCTTKTDIKERYGYIYISRRNEKIRKVENEDEVIQLLTSHGFKVIDVMDLSFYQQVMLFSTCKVFVSIHGAALTNAMFMPAGSKVLELYRSLSDGDTWMNTCYYNLITASGLDYYYQFCKHGANADTNIDKVNIIVDIPLLEKNLQLMIGVKSKREESYYASNSPAITFMLLIVTIASLSMLPRIISG